MISLFPMLVGGTGGFTCRVKTTWLCWGLAIESA